MKRTQKARPSYLFQYVRLVLRSLLFALVFLFYVFGKIELLESCYPLWIPVWMLFAMEMLLRFFPSPLESVGCQKHLRKNYIPKETEVFAPDPSDGRAPLMAALWLIGNGVIGLLYFLGIFDRTLLFLLALAYGVGDVVCILFFCPFQVFLLKNRCCTTCRAYNWDYAMLFTPFLFLPGIYTYSLLAIALGLLLHWEFAYHMHPERFSPDTNASLDCAHCEEKLCHQRGRIYDTLDTHLFHLFRKKK